MAHCHFSSALTSDCIGTMITNDTYIPFEGTEP